MHVYSGYYSEQGDVPVQTEEELLIASCGYYKFTEYSPFITNRPHGRDDFQLIYIHSGRMFFRFGDRTTAVGAGNCVLFHPNETQYYFFRSEDFVPTEYYWVHFLGWGCEELLKRDLAAQTQIFTVGVCDELTGLFDKIAMELQIKDPGFCTLNRAYFLQLIGLIARRLSGKKAGLSSINSELREAVIYMNTNYASDISISDYVKSKNYSLCWFARMFKQKYEVSPRKYLTNLRIMKAKELLLTTGYSIHEIARMTGHENQLYFSRVFRATVGCTPSEYRKRQKG